MRKSRISYLVMLSALIAVAACSDGGGSGDGGLSFQEGLPPGNVDGTYSISVNVTSNTCVGTANIVSSMAITLVQDGAEVVYLDEDGREQGRGVVSGDSFKIEEVESGSIGDGCTLSVSGTLVGSITGDDISGTMVVGLDFEGSCGDKQDCQATASLSGHRTAQTEFSMPQQEQPIEPAEGTTTLEPESSSNVSSEGEEAERVATAPATKEPVFSSDERTLWFFHLP